MSEATRGPESPVTDEVALLWERFKATASDEARDRLIINYSPLVKFVAGRVPISSKL